MIVSTGDCNHHDRLYTIQCTTNGRCITCNRWYIKPTTITAETYLQYKSAKQGCTRTDPLADILNNINKTMTANVNTHTHSSNKQSGYYEQQSSHNQEEEANDEEYKKTVTKNEHRQEKTNVPVDKRASSNDHGVVKTRSG